MSKNQSIENSEYKDNVRDEIVDQTVQWARSLCKKTIKILTLPGEQCLFEKKLVAKCKKHGIKVTGVCCENKNGSFLKMKNNLPEGLTPSSCDIECYTNRPFDLIWLDYCGVPHYQDGIRIKSLKKIVKQNPVSLLYVTFLTNALRIKGGIAEMRQVLLDEFGVTDDQHYSSSDIVKYAIHGHLVVGSKRVNHILNIVYAGGDSGVSDMQTLGYQSGMTKILPFNEQDWLTPVREENKVKYQSEEQVTDENKVQALLHKHQNKALSIVDQVKNVKASIEDELSALEKQMEAVKDSIKDDLNVLQGKLDKELKACPILGVNEVASYSYDWENIKKQARIAIIKRLRSDYDLTNGEIREYFKGSVQVWSHGATTERQVPTKIQICSVTNWMD